MSLAVKDSPFMSLGGQPYKLKSGTTIYKATSGIEGSIQALNTKAQQEAVISDACGDGGGCGTGASYIDTNISSYNIPMTTGVFTPKTDTGWIPSYQKFYETARFTAPRTLCCTNDFPMQERPELCCDTTSISTFYLAWRSCIHEHKFICGGANGYQEFNPEEARLQQTAIESMALFASLLAFNGSTDDNIIGLGNNPRIPNVSFPSLNSSFNDILRAVANAMSMLRMWESVALTADGSFTPQQYLWLIPSQYYDMLATRMNSQGVKLIDAIEGGSCCNTALNNDRPLYRLRIQPIPELNSHGPAKRPTGYIMKAGDLDWIRPHFSLDGIPDPNGSPYSILPPEREGLFETKIAWFRVGSVIPRHLDQIIRTQF